MKKVIELCKQLEEEQTRYMFTLNKMLTLVDGRKSREYHTLRKEAISKRAKIRRICKKLGIEDDRITWVNIAKFISRIFEVRE